MATTIAQLLATLGLDSSAFDKGIDAAENKSKGFSNTMLGLSNVGAGVLTAGFTTAAAGAALLGSEIYKDIGIAADAEKVQAQLEAVIKSTGGVAGVTAQAANELATALSSVTTFDDEAITSGESMLLTFTNIGEDVFPQATETILDMSQALGQDLQSSAIQLGKALNDPVQGITALQRVGVSFTDEQKKQVEAMVEAGKTEEAQRFILAELSKEFGGSAKAAGETFGGQMIILKNLIDNIRESVGAKFLPILIKLGKMFKDQLMKPEVLAFIDQLASAIASFVENAVNNIPKFIQGFKVAVQWLQDNKPIVVGILAALGVAVLAFGVTTAIAAYTALVPLLPIIAVMAAIGLAAYLLYRAWTENWGGIQEKAAAVWAFIQPLLAQLITWLQINIPAAIKALSAFWTGTLLPAIQSVWQWLSTTLFPFFQSIANFLSIVFTKIIIDLANVWTTELLPAITTLYNFLKTYVFPIFQAIGSFIGNRLVVWFNSLTETVQLLTGWINTLATTLSGMSNSIPDWLMPGSPTPFELGLLGIVDALDKVNQSSFLPKLPTNNMSLSPAAATVGGNNLSASGAQGRNYTISIAATIRNEQDIDHLTQRIVKRITKS